MDTFASTWAVRKITDFLAGISACEDEPSALVIAAEQAAEGLDAEIGAVVIDGRVRAALGMRPDDEAAAVLGDHALDGTAVDLPGLGRYVFGVTPLSSGHLVVGRGAATPFGADELAMLRSMGRVLEMALTSLRRLTTAQAHEASMKAIIRSSLDCVVSMSAEGTVTEWNPAAERTFGFTRAEVIGRRMDDLIIPEHLRDAHRAGLTHFLETGEGPVLDRRIEVPAVNRDGQEILVELAVTAIAGETPTFTAYLRDISDRVAAAERLQTTTERLTSLVENLNAAVMLENEDRTIGLANVRFCETFECGDSPAALVGVSCAEACARAKRLFADDEAFVRRTDEVFAAAVPVFDDTVAFADGRVFERDHIPVAVGEQRFGRLWVYRDVTARIAFERELATARDDAVAASRLKSSFLATMSHEIRTPMNGVVGLVDLLAASALDDDQRELVRMLGQSSDHLLEVIDDILDFSRIEAGELRLDTRPFVPANTIRDTVQLFTPRAAANGIDLRTSIAADLAETYVSDSGRIRQILQNLVGNAIKFTHQGTIDVRATVDDARIDGSQVLTLAVSDTGIGIPPEAARRLFEPFVQADTSTSRLYGGSGLGLSICQRLAELLGGTIAVESSPAGGSTFTVRIPLARATAPTPIVECTAVAGRGARTTGRILVVEDNEVNQTVVRRQLDRLGHEVEIVSGGSAALDYLRSRDVVDVVLMDCQMPGMDGFETTRAIRSLHGPNARVPIVAMTANALSEDRDACLAAGMDDYLAKPVRSDALDAVLGKWMRNRPTPSGSQAEDRLAVIDRRVIDDLVADLGGDETVVGEIASVFLRELGPRTDAVRRGLAGSDRNALRERAHALRSPSRALGLAWLDSVCERIERSAINGDLAAARGLEPELDAAGAATRRELERLAQPGDPGGRAAA